MSSWGQRPDGRRYGTTPIIPLTECPKNGFVYFDEKFSPTEKQKLTPLVLGSEYQAMRKTETPHYRAWWLMERLGRDAYDRAYMLLVSSWEADDNPQLKTRYQQSFIDAVGALSWSEEKRDDWFWINLRAANALRELGRFAQSDVLLAGLDKPEKLPKDPDALKGARFLIDGLRQLNAEKNPAREPTNLIPARMAVDRCVGQPSALSPAEKKACSGPDLHDALKEMRHLRESN
jgi:hypothetical protein